ncbi:MAG: hypothetical protein ABI263_06490 [Gelidibacter sp.]
MQDFILLLTVLSSSFVGNAHVPVKDVAGTYEKYLFSTNSHIINYTLNLNADGTFRFHASDKIGIQQKTKFICQRCVGNG